METTERLTVFLKVAELLSFSRASEHLGLPRTTVSTTIRELEDALGARLFHRTTRKVRLTRDGEALVERAEHLVGELDALLGMFREGPAVLRGRLRVDVPTGVARDLIVPRLPEFFREHPELTLELSSTDRRVDVIREGFDCVLRAGPIADESVVFRTIGAYDMINCASAEYVASRGRPRRIAELAEHVLVDYVPTFGQRSTGFEYAVDGQIHAVPMRTSLTANAVDTYVGACLAGLGIVQIPSISARPHLATGQLVEVLPRFRPDPLPVSLVLPNRRHLPERVRAFMIWLEALVGPRLSRRAPAPPSTATSDRGSTRRATPSRRG